MPAKDSEETEWHKSLMELVHTEYNMLLAQCVIPQSAYPTDPLQCQRLREELKYSKQQFDLASKKKKPSQR